MFGIPAFSLNPFSLVTFYIDLLQTLVVRMVQSMVETLKFPIGVTFFIGGQIGEGLGTQAEGIQTEG